MTVTTAITIAGVIELINLYSCAFFRDGGHRHLISQAGNGSGF